MRGLKARDTGQAYVDGLVTHYNPVYFSPNESLDGKRPVEAAGAELPFTSWTEIKWARITPKQQGARTDLT